jgi:hypothetical protein
MEYSLALYSKDKVVFSSVESGLRPLFSCIQACIGKFDGCTLEDKVVGLAAARLIVYSGMISKVITPIASKKAVELLKSKGIEITAEQVVDRILTKDRKNTCPMEQKAMQMDNIEFYKDLQKIFTG